MYTHTWNTLHFSDPHTQKYTCRARVPDRVELSFGHFWKLTTFLQITA
jgi:hypothetical protein